MAWHYIYILTGLLYSLCFVSTSCFQLNSALTFILFCTPTARSLELGFQCTTQVPSSSAPKVMSDCYNLCYSHRRWWRTILKSILLDGQQNALVSCWTHTRPHWEHKGRCQLSQAFHLVSISWDTGVLQRKRWDNECVLAGYTSFLSGSKSNWEVNPTAKIFNEN